MGRKAKRPAVKARAAKKAASLITSGKVSMNTVRKMKLSPTTAKAALKVKMTNKKQDKDLINWGTDLANSPVPRRVPRDKY